MKIYKEESIYKEFKYMQQLHQRKDVKSRPMKTNRTSARDAETPTHSHTRSLLQGQLAGEESGDWGYLFSLHPLQGPICSHHQETKDQVC